MAKTAGTGQRKKGDSTESPSSLVAEKRKVGRPRIEIDVEQLEKLAEMQCTYDELAAWFDVSKATLSDNFRTEIAKGREKGKMSLRRKQWKLADTSAAMAIFLGKNYLEQSDNPDQDNSEMYEGTEFVDE